MEPFKLQLLYFEDAANFLLWVENTLCFLQASYTNHTGKPEVPLRSSGMPSEECGGWLGMASSSLRKPLRAF